MEKGLAHLAGTGSRVSAERLRERPYMPTTKPFMPITNMEMSERLKGLPSCKAMTPQCMGREKYNEYVERGNKLIR